MTTGVIAVNVTRGPLVESIHYGHAAVVDTSGRLLFAAGSPATVIFARSAAKPLQALPVVEAGVAERFGLHPEHVAMLCASHSGEPLHVKLVSEMLSLIHASAEQLTCGAHEPYDADAAANLRAAGDKPTPVHNNCSGKHTGMLALAAAKGWDREGYAKPEHPVQQAMLEAVSAMCGLRPAEVPLGTDGCGVPVFAVPLSRLAAAYARLGAPEAAGLPPARIAACRQITAAWTAHPECVAGSNRFDTRLAEVTGGRLLGKMGAEGVFAVTYPSQGLGAAVKMEDGAMRALYPAVAELLGQLQWLSPAELEALEPFRRPPVTNWRGDIVGSIEPAVRLEAFSPM
ncbi:asparaginase [Paenibacillus sp. y28]|uniref:asparaginase n=1 Tax=Paenibacillus sp. y28 TaxID=3129110 RepID=UPI00301ACC05